MFQDRQVGYERVAMAGANGMAMLEERSKTAGILFATPNPKVACRYCDQAIVIADRKITLRDNFDEAVSLLNQVVPAGC